MRSAKHADISRPFSRRAFVACAIAVLGAPLLAGCSTSTGQKAGSADGGTLRVAMELAYPPFETRDDAGDPSGVSVDFIKRFGERYGYDVKIVNTAWDGIIPSLQTGKADLAISSITITDERREQVDFSDPYAMAQLAILAGKDSGIKTANDLDAPGMTVAVKTGSTGDVYATKHFTEAKILRFTDESACVVEVVQGRADGFIYDQLTVYRNSVKNPDATRAVFIPLQDPEPWGVAVAKGNDDLCEQLNEFIAACKQDGTFDELTDTYLHDERAAFDELGFRWFFDFDEQGGDASLGEAR